jgi:Restriction endonuclease NotI
MAATKWCPFIDASCKKTRSGGACSISLGNNDPVIICPQRLYGDNFLILREIAAECFGGSSELLNVSDVASQADSLSGNKIVVYGQGFTKELGISAPAEAGEDSGSFKIDFILAKINKDLSLHSFVAVEVQTIDTTNTYKDISEKYYVDAVSITDRVNDYDELSIFRTDADHYHNAGLNWENVSKRILPQLIYKGHALRRERLAQNGLYFVLPHQVFTKIMTRVGGRLLDYPKGPGTITFKSFVLSDAGLDGKRRVLPKDTFTTTVEQLAFAFVSPQNLPALGVYEATLTKNLAKLSRKRNR